jgi:hypothetical protein
MSIRKASECYGVPPMTISNAARQVCQSHRVGSSTLLGPEVERIIAASIANLADWGFGLCRLEKISIAENYLESISQPKKLSPKWFKGFMSRFGDQLRLCIRTFTIAIIKCSW